MSDGFFSLLLRDAAADRRKRLVVPVLLQESVPEAASLAELGRVVDSEMGGVFAEQGRALKFRARRVRGGWGFVFFDSRNKSDYTVYAAGGRLRLWRSVKALKSFIRENSNSDSSSFINLE